MSLTSPLSSLWCDERIRQRIKSAVVSSWTVAALGLVGLVKSWSIRAGLQWSAEWEKLRERSWCSLINPAWYEHMPNVFNNPVGPLLALFCIHFISSWREVSRWDPSGHMRENQVHSLPYVQPSPWFRGQCLEMFAFWKQTFIYLLLQQMYSSCQP